jgi:hypothetical protein
MQIIVNELPIEDALERARQRFERADRRLAEALTGHRTTLPWTLLGVLALAGGRRAGAAGSRRRMCGLRIAALAAQARRDETANA